MVNGKIMRNGNRGPAVDVRQGKCMLITSMNKPCTRTSYRRDL